jgi:protein-tyrosine-phosphatase
MAESKESILYSELASYVGQSEKMFAEVPEDRKSQLENIATFVQDRLKARQVARLTFICTHNSRRSQMSQIWAQTAAAYYGITSVAAFSGGTEATAFNPRSVGALERAGFVIERTSDKDNPVYLIRFNDNAPAIEAFSKIFNQKPNPTEDFCAVMTCSQADKDCPVVLGALRRVSIPYEDPKAFDGTGGEAAMYDERCRQISREMLYLFSMVNC